MPNTCSGRLGLHSCGRGSGLFRRMCLAAAAATGETVLKLLIVLATVASIVGELFRNEVACRFILEITELYGIR